MALTKVSSSLVSDNAVTTAKIVDGGIATADIADVAVTTAKIANNAILTQHIDDGQVTTAQLGADAVTAAKIADDAISEEHLDVTVITSLSAVTAATGDLLMVADVSDSNNLKKIPVSSILAGTHTGPIGSGSNAVNVGTVTATGNLSMATDNATIFIGADLDLRLTHTGSHGTIINNTGNLTLDVAGGITLDADGGQVDFKDAGTLKALIDFTSSNVEIQSRVTDADMIFRGQDGSSFITALTLDMSEAGAATFNSSVTATGDYTAGNDASMFIFQRAGGAVSGNIEYNDATTDMEFGTTTAHNFSLKTANTRRLTIDNAGTATFTGTAQATRVGIGVAPHATAGLNITSTAQHVRFNNGSELGIISLESDGALRIWSHGDSSNNEIEFYQGSGSGAASMTIDGSGNVLVGQTSNSETGTGIGLVPDGTSHMYSANTDALMLGRGGSDGEILSFNRSGTTVGVIGVAASDNIYFAGSTGSTKGIYINNAAVYPANTGGDVINNAVDLGQTGTRWKNIYSSGVVYISDGISNSGAAGSATVFNEDGTTADFRVESDSNEHMLVVNGGTNRVGIGEVAPDRTLHVNSGTTNVAAKFESTDSITAIEFTDSGGSAEIGNDGSDVVLFPAGTEKFRVQNSTGYLVAQSASQVRLVLGSTGNSSNNTSNWIRGTGNELGLNSGGGNIGIEIGGSAKATINATGQILANPLGVTVPTFSFIGDTNTGMTRPTGDTLQFVTGGSAKWRINSSGHLVPENQHTVDIGGTNAEVRNVYAQGISFASNANASGMTSELLDDYEEGTWVPGFGGATLSSYTATYTKIGNQVTVHYRILTTGSMPTSTAQVQISGLPFTINSIGAAAVYARFYTPNDSTLTSLTVDGDTYIRLININEQNFDYTIYGELEASSNNSVDIRGTATYTV